MKARPLFHTRHGFYESKYIRTSARGVLDKLSIKTSFTSLKSSTFRKPFFISSSSQYKSNPDILVILVSYVGVIADNEASKVPLIFQSCDKFSLPICDFRRGGTTVVRVIKKSREFVVRSSTKAPL